MQTRSCQLSVIVECDPRRST